MLKIGIDLDGVVFDIMTPLVQHYNIDFDDNMTVEEQTDWEFSKCRYKNPKLVYNYLHDPRIQYEAPVEPFAVEALQEILNMENVDVCFATATSRCVVHAKISRLETMLPSRKYSYGFFIGHEKTRLDCDLFLEDQPNQVFKMLQEGRRVIVFNHPWNQKMIPPINFHDSWRLSDYGTWQGIRVNGWEKVPSLVRELKEILK